MQNIKQKNNKEMNVLLTHAEHLYIYKGPSALLIYEIIGLLFCYSSKSPVVSITICQYTFYYKLEFYSYYLHMRIHIFDYAKNLDILLKI